MCISDLIEEIKPDTFISCTKLRRVELPETVKKVGANAFGASKLEFMIVPASLKYIGKNAFGDCKNLYFLLYAGTQSEWNKITFEDENDPIKSARIYYYSPERPVDDGNRYWYMINGKSYFW